MIHTKIAHENDPDTVVWSGTAPAIREGALITVYGVYSLVRVTYVETHFTPDNSVMQEVRVR
jgi:hypothetical protein